MLLFIPRTFFSDFNPSVLLSCIITEVPGKDTREHLNVSFISRMKLINQEM